MYGLWLMYLFRGSDFACIHQSYSVDSIFKATERYLATGVKLNEEQQEAYPKLSQADIAFIKALPVHPCQKQGCSNFGK